MMELLWAYLDNTDSQELSLATKILGISSGTATIDLSAYINTDTQDLTSATLTNNQLTIAIENGNSVQVDLSAILTPLQNENTTQQTQIDDLITRMETLEVCDCSGTLGVNHTPEEKANTAILFQNIPNPFNGTSSIKYYVPDTTNKAWIVFSNNSGQVMSKCSIGCGRRRRIKYQ